MPHETKILATGFGPFPGARTNPSAQIVRALWKRRRRLARYGTVRLAIDVLPVVWGEAQARIRRDIEAFRPDLVLLFGVAGRRTWLAVETRAANRAGVLRPDAAKRIAAGSLLQKGGPAQRKARLPAARAAAAARRTGTACRLSIDAGTYLCNATFFEALATDAPFVAFVHTPQPMERRRLDDAKRPRVPSQDELDAAGFEILRALIGACRAGAVR